MSVFQEWSFQSWSLSLPLLWVSRPCLCSLLSLCVYPLSLSRSCFFSLLLQLSLCWRLCSVWPSLLLSSLGGVLLRSRFRTGESLLRRPLLAECPSLASSMGLCRPVDRRVLRRKRLLVLRKGHFNLTEMTTYYQSENGYIFIARERERDKVRLEHFQSDSFLIETQCFVA